MPTLPWVSHLRFFFHWYTPSFSHVQPFEEYLPCLAISHLVSAMSSHSWSSLSERLSVFCWTAWSRRWLFESGPLPVVLSARPRQLSRVFAKMSEIKQTQLALKKGQVWNIVNYLLRKKDTRTFKNSRVQKIWNKLF